MSRVANIMDEKRPISSKKILISHNRNNVLEVLNEFRASKHLCDLILVSCDQEFPVHRVVLAATGCFFRALFASGMKEQSQNRIDVSQIEPDIMNDILGYLYYGEIEVSYERAQTIIMAADFLLLGNLKGEVDKFFAEQIQDQECSLGPDEICLILQFASQYKCESLEKVAMSLACKYFEAVFIKAKDIFLELDAKTIQGIISSDDLVTPSEEQVFQAVVEWARHRQERGDCFHLLLSQVRLFSLEKEYIFSTVLNEPLVSSNPACSKYVLDKTEHYEPATANVQHHRSCLDQHTNVILVFPQHYWSEEANLPCGPWCYVPSQNSWYHIHPPCEFAVFDHISNYSFPLYYQGFLITVNVEQEEPEAVINVCKLETMTWSNVGNIPDHFIICNQKAACLNGILYLIGGEKYFEDRGCLAVGDVYAFDLSEALNKYNQGTSMQSDKEKANYEKEDLCVFKNAWDEKIEAKLCEFKELAFLNTGRQNHFLVSDDKHIYALGGYVSHLNKATNTFERYNPEQNKWSYLAPMETCSLRSQCALANRKIFVVQEKLEAEYDLVYDINSDSWSQIPNSPLRACSGVLVQCEEKLILVSGGDGRNSSDFQRGNIVKTIAYDIKDNAWSDVLSTIEVKPDWELDERHDLSCIDLAGVVVRLRKDFVSSLKPLPQGSHSRDYRNYIDF